MHLTAHRLGDPRLLTRSTQDVLSRTRHTSKSKAHAFWRRVVQTSRRSSPPLGGYRGAPITA
eukprot:3558984-Prymnesium_polylepis.1